MSGPSDLRSKAVIAEVAIESPQRVVAEIVIAVYPPPMPFATVRSQASLGQSLRPMNRASNRRPGN